MWELVQSKIDACRQCECLGVPYIRVPKDSKRHPPYPPPNPTRLLFVGVAPPWGGDYFWDESKSDRVRRRLFTALEQATGERFSNVRAFWEAGYFIVPGVKCPSEGCDKDHLPHPKAIANCAVHLRAELSACRPQRILALGACAMRSVAESLELQIPRQVNEFRKRIWLANLVDIQVPVCGTYFVGNDRHKGFSHIVGDIRRITNTST